MTKCQIKTNNLSIKQWIAVFTAIFIFTTSSIASAAEKTLSDELRAKGAEAFVEKLTNKALSSLTEKGLSDTKRQKRMRGILKTNFDMKTIGRFSLGKHWRTASKNQKDEYLSLFENMVVKTYSMRFKDYGQQTFAVTGNTIVNKRDIIIHSKLTDNSQAEGSEAPAFFIDWRIRYKKGAYRVIDLIVEGISMGITQRSDFSAVIQKGGGNIESLLDTLRGHNNTKK